MARDSSAAGRGQEPSLESAASPNEEAPVRHRIVRHRIVRHPSSPVAGVLLAGALLLAACSAGLDAAGPTPPDGDGAVDAGGDGEASGGGAHSDQAAAAPGESGEEDAVQQPQLFEVVDDAEFDPTAEVTEGLNWELLTSQPRTFQRVGVGIGSDPADVERVWASFRMAGDPPAIQELDEELLVVSVPATCAFVLRDVVFEELRQDEVGADIQRIRLVAQAPDPCDDPDETGRFLALSIDAEVMDADRIEVAVGEGTVGLETRF